MSRQHHRKQRFKLRSFYVWHRYMGVTAALFALIIAVTGLLLNHTEDFQFDSRYVKSAWVLDWYGIKAPKELLSFTANSRYITLMGEHLYLNRREIPGEFHDLAGAVYLQDMYAVAVSDAIVLLTRRGEIVDQLHGEDGVPAHISAIGIDSNGLLVAAAGESYYQADKDFLTWQRRESADDDVRWARPGSLDRQTAAWLRAHYRGEVLPVERVILDLHSGRFFGRGGPWIFDIAACLLILLALSGTWIWLRRRR
jgi:PepSY-associated TM region